ncbi:TlyA family RNA methyltransferase [Spiroplasma endosymbiont of Aspidapion aeneum]|uniref:TlyA family RNA methyltransferase n=1 Tax=Spiroplasma endosymbiont of Aspidapion aeneum TaxID=3066276 RepID=UPI00313E74D3
MKKRLDEILVDLNHFENRSKSKSNIIVGNVIVNNEKITKPGTLFNPEKLNIQLINQNQERFVSRAGSKLYKAIIKYGLNLDGLVCLDIGSSTGGFSDCCLQMGASLVYAVDVGTNQLDYRLRTNPKIVSMEKLNFRDVKIDMFEKEINFFCCDVSFISLKHILPPLKDIVKVNTFGVLLIKPQFESSRENVKAGKINSKNVHIEVIESVFNYLNINYFDVIEIDFSPILGNKKKNIEYITVVKKRQDKKKETNKDINSIINCVNSAWDFFKDNDYERI